MSCHAVKGASLAATVTYQSIHIALQQLGAKMVCTGEGLVSNRKHANREEGIFQFYCLVGISGAQVAPVCTSLVV